MENKNKSQVTNYLVNGFLLIAVVVLFVIYFVEKRAMGSSEVQGVKTTQSVTLEDGTVIEEEVAVLPIAYVQSDSIYKHYRFFIDQTDEMLKKYNSDMNNLKSRDKKIQQEYQKFVEDVNNNRYLYQDEIRQKQVSFERRMEELQEAAMKIEQNNQMKRVNLSVQLSDSIKNVIDILNADNRYQMIFLNEGLTTILYANKAYDITDELVEVLNSRYPKK